MRLLIRGRVQGVGFRWFVRNVAVRLGLVGFAENLPDGAVQVMAEGESSNLESLEAACRKGPPSSRVDSVDRFLEPLDRCGFPDFGIR